jgi:hypothetical protein
MLLIAISFGFENDPFTCSTQGPDFFDPVTKAGVDPKNAKMCRDFIAKEKDLDPETIDEVLVVYSPDYDEPPEVMHHHSEFDDEDEG